MQGLTPPKGAFRIAKASQRHEGAAISCFASCALPPKKGNNVRCLHRSIWHPANNSIYIYIYTSTIIDLISRGVPETGACYRSAFALYLFIYIYVYYIQLNPYAAPKIHSSTVVPRSRRKTTTARQRCAMALVGSLSNVLFAVFFVVVKDVSRTRLGIIAHHQRWPN